MSDRIRFRSDVAGQYVRSSDLPAEGDIVTTLLAKTFSFDVPKDTFDGDETKSLTLEAAIQMAFDKIMVAAALED